MVENCFTDLEAIHGYLSKAAPSFLHEGISAFPRHRRHKHTERDIPLVAVRLRRAGREHRVQPRLYHRQRRRLLAEQRLRFPGAAVMESLRPFRHILYSELHHPKYHRRHFLQLAGIPARGQLPGRRRPRRPGHFFVREAVRV